MRFRVLIETFFSIMLISGICLSDDEAFMSMNGDCRYPAVAVEENSVFLTSAYREFSLLRLNGVSQDIHVGCETVQNYQI